MNEQDKAKELADRGKGLKMALKPNKEEYLKITRDGDNDSIYLTIDKVVGQSAVNIVLKELEGNRKYKVHRIYLDDPSKHESRGVTL